MGLIKQSAIIGHNYLRNGIGDDALWSRMMLHNLGPRIKPYLREIRKFSQMLAAENFTVRKTRENCWEYKDCGGSRNGVCQSAKDICPVLFETRLDGVYGGMNGGRACWMVEGTMCRRRMPASFFQRFKICKACDFYQAVRAEEGAGFMPLRHLFQFVERREYKRFLVKEGTYAVLQPDFPMPCRVVDISQAGLAFYYDSADTMSNQALTLDVLFEEERFSLRKIPYRIISDIVPPSELSAGPAKVRRCGVEFGKLFRAQKTLLDCFIRNHTRGENHINISGFA